MSIMKTDGPIAKRRKLSHDSSDDGTSSEQTSGDNDSVDIEVSNTQNTTKAAANSSKGTDQLRTRTSTMLTGGLTKSSVTQLQIDELLDEIILDHHHYLKGIQPFLDKLVATIKAVPERSPLSLTEAETSLRKKHGIAIPFGFYRPSPDVKYKFEFVAPERVAPRADLFRVLAIKGNADLELAVAMPSTMFQEKDYLNYRALHKRAYYLACIAAAIQERFESTHNCRYELYQENEMVPVIIMKFKDPEGARTTKAFTIIVNVTFPAEVFPTEKLLPNRSCIRTSHENSSSAENRTEPTPQYNSTISSLSSISTVDRFLAETTRKCDAFGNACILGQIWLRQRGFSSDSSKGGFGSSDWAYTCALLLSSGGHRGHPMFSERYSTIQLFKAMLQVLANRDLTDPLVIFGSDLKLEKGDMPVLYDARCGVNVLARMTSWSYAQLQQYARVSLGVINTKTQDNFEFTFISKVAEPNLQYDEVYTVNVLSREITVSAFNSTLRKGFSDRVSLIYLKEHPRQPWDLRKPGPTQSKDSRKLDICLSVNPETTSRLIDHGPTAEEQEASRDFRRFWGEKAELRRFRDGSITETLVWSPEEPVTLQIIRYLLAYYFKIAPSSIESRTPDLRLEHLASQAVVVAEDAFKVINSKFQELSSKLHQMEGLPLPIRSVSPAGQALRSSSAGHPLDTPTSAPIDILIQFDSSSRWPDHLLAIQHTKVAFLAKISDLLIESDSSLTTRIGLENPATSTTGYYNTSFLDVISPSPGPGLTPMVFRLRVHHERESQLLKSLVADKSLSGSAREAVAVALLEHKRTFEATPIHTASIRNLITHFPQLSSTIRLLKAWVASHHLSNHLPAPALEMIAARVFLQPYPWSTPSTTTTAFLRCLYFLSRWDWATTPIILDLSLSQDMTAAQITELETRFQAWKQLDPNMNNVAWFVGTNIDSTGTVWTQGARPARVVATRVTALATAAIELVKSKAATMRTDDWRSLFISSISDFDFVIHLKASVLKGGRKGRKNSELKFKNLQVQEDLDVDGIGHDIVALYLTDLERLFASAVLFFHGERDTHIAGLWKPSVVDQKDWRVRLGYSSVPLALKGETGSDQIKETSLINNEGILAEIALLGEGIIENIVVKK